MSNLSLIPDRVLTIMFEDLVKSEYDRTVAANVLSTISRNVGNLIKAGYDITPVVDNMLSEDAANALISGGKFLSKELIQKLLNKLDDVSCYKVLRRIETGILSKEQVFNLAKSCDDAGALFLRLCDYNVPEFEDKEIKTWIDDTDFMELLLPGVLRKNNIRHMAKAICNSNILTFREQVLLAAVFCVHEHIGIRAGLVRCSGSLEENNSFYELPEYYELPDYVMRMLASTGGIETPEDAMRLLENGYAKLTPLERYNLVAIARTSKDNARTMLSRSALCGDRSYGLSKNDRADLLYFIHDNEITPKFAADAIKYDVELQLLTQDELVELVATDVDTTCEILWYDYKKLTEEQQLVLIKALTPKNLYRLIKDINPFYLKADYGERVGNEIIRVINEDIKESTGFTYEEAYDALFYKDTKYGFTRKKLLQIVMNSEEQVVKLLTTKHRGYRSSSTMVWGGVTPYEVYTVATSITNPELAKRLLQEVDEDYIGEGGMRYLRLIAEKAQKQ